MFPRWATLVAALLIVSPAGFASAQHPPQDNPGANVARFGVAVVDVSYIFRKYARFTAMMDQMKSDVQAAEQQLNAERKQIQQAEEDLKASYKPGTPDYKRREEEITEEKTRFNVQATKQRNDFLDREAQIYYQAYLEVYDAVKYHAQQNNIGLVLRFNGDPVDPSNRQDILRAINKPVVYHGGIDVTGHVINSLNRTPVGHVPAGPGNRQIPR